MERLRRISSFRTFWGLADQGVTSVGSFLVTLGLAHSLSATDYGTFVVIFSVVLFVNSIHASLIGYPLIVNASTLDIRSSQEFFAHSIIISAVIGICVGLLVFGAVISTSGDFFLAFAVALAMLLWQVQQTSRNALISQSRFFEATLGDAASFLGRGGVVLVLGITRPVNAFWVIAGTSLVGLLIQIWQIRPGGTIRIESLRAVGAELWSLGSWSAGSTLVGGLTLLVFVIGLAWVHGSAEVAKYQAVANVVGLTNPLILSLSTILLPAIALAAARQGHREALLVGLRQSLLPSAVFIVMVCAIALAPKLILRSFYGSQSGYADLSVPLRLFVVAYVFSFVGGVFGAYLNAVRRPQDRLKAQVGTLISAAIVGIVLIWAYQVVGASVGLATSYGAGTIIMIVLAIRAANLQPHKHISIDSNARSTARDCV